MFAGVGLRFRSPAVDVRMLHQWHSGDPHSEGVLHESGPADGPSRRSVACCQPGQRVAPKRLAWEGVPAPPLVFCSLAAVRHVFVYF